MKRYAIIKNGEVINTVVADEPQADNWLESDTAQIGCRYENNNFTDPAPGAVTVNVTNIHWSNAESKNGIFCINAGVTAIAVADMIPVDDMDLPNGEMRVIVEKQVRGQTVEEMPFTATITAADGETPARLSLPLKLAAGFYKITPERLNTGLANPKINAPYRLQFDAIDIDCVGAV